MNLHLLEITRHQQKILFLPRFQHSKGFPIVTKIMFFLSLTRWLPKDSELPEY